jgi:hypothetical protein
MQDKPAIKTAIPKRRYQISDYSATLLGEIEAGDGRGYRWVLALMPMGESEPTLYVCCEQSAAPGGVYDVRVVNEAMSEVVDSDARWRDLDTFAEAALDLAKQLLGLQKEQSLRLL